MPARARIVWVKYPHEAETGKKYDFSFLVKNVGDDYGLLVVLLKNLRKNPGDIVIDSMVIRPGETRQIFSIYCPPGGGGAPRMRIMFTVPGRYTYMLLAGHCESGGLIIDHRFSIP